MQKNVESNFLTNFINLPINENSFASQSSVKKLNSPISKNCKINAGRFWDPQWWGIILIVVEYQDFRKIINTKYYMTHDYHDSFGQVDKEVENCTFTKRFIKTIIFDNFNFRKTELLLLKLMKHSRIIGPEFDKKIIFNSSLVTHSFKTALNSYAERNFRTESQSCQMTYRRITILQIYFLPIIRLTIFFFFFSKML